MIAPASLKLRLLRPEGYSGQYRPLRGMIAPASLKPTPYVTGKNPPPDATPGHDCPGLIEAATVGGVGIVG